MKSSVRESGGYLITPPFVGFHIALSRMGGMTLLVRLTA